MNKGSSNCGDSNHMLFAWRQIKFLRPFAGQQSILTMVAYTARTVALERGICSYKGRWNERPALCI